MIAAVDGGGAKARSPAVVDDVEIRFTMSKSTAHLSERGPVSAATVSMAAQAEHLHSLGHEAERFLSLPRQAQPR